MYIKLPALARGYLLAQRWSAVSLSSEARAAGSDSTPTLARTRTGQGVHRPTREKITSPKYAGNGLHSEQLSILRRGTKGLYMLFNTNWKVGGQPQ